MMAIRSVTGSVSAAVSSGKGGRQRLSCAEWYGVRSADQAYAAELGRGELSSTLTDAQVRWAQDRYLGM